MDFSVMDDSLAYHNGLYVYSHCILDSQDHTGFLVISGDNKSIYNEERIRDFVMDNLGMGEDLYACSHYWDRYASLHPFITDVYPFVIDIIDNHLGKNIRNLFVQAHHSAKAIAKQSLEKILNANP